MKYFKKKKMYELAQKFGYTDMPLLKYCTYRFHRGWETLDFCLDSGNIVHFAFVRPGNYFLIRETSVIEIAGEDIYDEVRNEVIFEKKYKELLS